MQPNLAKGIKTLAVTVTGLSASNFFLVKAPDGQTGQYCVCYSLNDTPEIDSATQFEMESLQFTFIGIDLSALMTLVENFKSVFDFTSSLSVTNYTVIEVRRRMERGPENFGNVWQIILEYLIQLEKAR